MISNTAGARAHAPDDDLTILGRVHEATKTVLEQLPAAIAAAKRLEAANYPGAAVVAASLGEASERGCGGTPIAVDEDLTMLFRAAGDLGKWLSLFYVDELKYDPGEAVREVYENGRNPKEARALLEYLHSAS